MDVETTPSERYGCLYRLRTTSSVRGQSPSRQSWLGVKHTYGVPIRRWRLAKGLPPATSPHSPLEGLYHSFPLHVYWPHCLSVNVITQHPLHESDERRWRLCIRPRNQRRTPTYTEVLPWCAHSASHPRCLLRGSEPHHAPTRVDQTGHQSTPHRMECHCVHTRHLLYGWCRRDHPQSKVGPPHLPHYTGSGRKRSRSGR